jgi:hypothetical protein
MWQGVPCSRFGSRRTVEQALASRIAFTTSFYHTRARGARGDIERFSSKVASTRAAADWHSKLRLRPTSTTSEVASRRKVCAVAHATIRPLAFRKCFHLRILRALSAKFSLPKRRFVNPNPSPALDQLSSGIWLSSFQSLRSMPNSMLVFSASGYRIGFRTGLSLCAPVQIITLSISCAGSAEHFCCPLRPDIVPLVPPTPQRPSQGDCDRNGHRSVD